MLVLPNAPASNYTDFVPSAPMTETKKWDQLRERLFFVVEKCAAEHDIPLEMIVEYGDPADKIISLAKREEIDVIVIGSSSKGAIERRIKGSISLKVASNAGCSVFIVR